VFEGVLEIFFWKLKISALLPTLFTFNFMEEQNSVKMALVFLNFEQKTNGYATVNKKKRNFTIVLYTQQRAYEDEKHRDI
jgi:hypothetical protein